MDRERKRKRERDRERKRERGRERERLTDTKMFSYPFHSNQLHSRVLDSGSFHWNALQQREAGTVVDYRNR